MHLRSRLIPLSLLLATTSLSLGVAPAWAQPAPDEPAPAAAGDPPSEAGRLSAVTGTVSTHAAGQTDWTAATLNAPVTTGDGFWTEPQSSATIEIGDDHFVLNEATELDVAGLDATQFTGTEAQGEVFMDLPQLPQGQSVTVNTPRGTVQITTPGQYDIVAGDTDAPTIVTVISGSAQVTGTGVNVTVGANQAATISGADQFTASVGAAAPDAFVQAQLNVPAPPPLPRNVPPQVHEMTGGADLAAYGAWQATSDYGQVWYPTNVPEGWAPYREGHWAYVAPWGWTWVDQEPWGFAPFHYGRWVFYDGRWGWVAAAPDAPPGDFPVYAPALVGFVGVGGGIGVSFGFGAGYFGAGGGVGWVPLGFREPYRPWYHVSERYLQNVNRVSVVNVRNITIENIRNVSLDHYANARFATVAPAAALERGEPLRGVARPMPVAMLARAQPVVGRLPVRPTAQTPGLTRVEAARFHVALPAHPVGRVLPGPRIAPAGVVAHPMLRPAAPGEARHFGPGVPAPRIGEGMPRPGMQRPGLPPLRPAGEVDRRPPVLTPGEAGRHALPGHPAPEARHPEERPAPGEAPRGFGTPHAPEARPGVPVPRPGEEARRPVVPEHVAAPERREPTPEHREAAPEHREAAPERREAAPEHREEHPRPEPRAVEHAPPPRPHPAPHPAPRPAPHPAPRPAPHAEPSHPDKHP